MRGLISLLFLIFFANGFAQDTIQNSSENQELQSTQLKPEAPEEVSNYTLGNEEFRFIPDALGFSIVKVENGNEVDYGHLRLTTDDGYYVMTSAINDHVSYGRFDDKGNFNAMRLDEATDKVVEEHFLIASSD